MVTYANDANSLYERRAPLPFGLAHAMTAIYDTYGDVVAIKPKTVLKFGRNEGLGTAMETIWQAGGDETYVTTNAIDKISSSDDGDEETITIEGHTVTGTGTDAQFTFVVQTKTLQGQTETALDTPLARVSRAYVSSANAVNGVVYIYEDDTVTSGVPQTASKIHITIDGANGFTQSFKAATTFSNEDYYICTGMHASVAKKTSAIADFQLEIRMPGGVFRPITRISLGTTSSPNIYIPFDPPVVCPRNSDIRVRAIASTTAVDVEASFNGYLALVQT